jgi:hypothetical protein
MENLDRKKFFDGVRTMFGGSLTQDDVDAINTVLELIHGPDDPVPESWDAAFGDSAEDAKTLLADCWVEDADSAAQPDDEPAPDAPHPSTVLTDADFERAAAFLNCDSPAIRAVVQVETSGSGFLSDGRTKILFEAHVFGRLTGHRFDGEVDRNGVSLSVRSWDRSLYGAGGGHQYERLEDAAKLDEVNANAACSWGAGQILGSNFKAAGFNDVMSFVTAMKTGGAAAQLDAMASFIKNNHIDGALRSHDWARVARAYNGPGYAQNGYDTKLEQAYEHFAG